MNSVKSCFDESLYVKAPIQVLQDEELSEKFWNRLHALCDWTKYESVHGAWRAWSEAQGCEFGAWLGRILDVEGSDDMERFLNLVTQVFSGLEDVAHAAGCSSLYRAVKSWQNLDEDDKDKAVVLMHGVGVTLYQWLHWKILNHNPNLDEWLRLFQDERVLNVVAPQQEDVEKEKDNE